MSKKCVCGNEMTREDWKHEWVCHRCGRKRPIPLPPMFTVFMCRKCEHLLYVEEDAHIVIAMANHNMNVTDVARAIFAHRNTVLYHLDKVKRQTGLDPRRFYDLIELVKMA